MSDRKILAQEFVSLKARIKAEMLRRAQVGAVSAYGGAAYDYANIPASGVKISLEHIDKNLEPLRAVNPGGLPALGEKPALESNMLAMEAKTTLFEYTAMRGGSNDCAASCAGLCYGCTGTCTGSCSGCTGCSGCGGGCSYNCTGCSGTCSGCSGCGEMCSNTCSSGCGGACAFNCSGYCSGTCTGCSRDCMSTCAQIAR